VGHNTFSNLPGPVPMIFSEDPAATLKELNSSPKLAFDYFQILLSRLLDTEQISREQAAAFLDNPTLGTTKTPLVRTWETIAGKRVAATPTPKADKGTYTQLQLQL